MHKFNIKSILNLLICYYCSTVLSEFNAQVVIFIALFDKLLSSVYNEIMENKKHKFKNLRFLISDQRKDRVFANWTRVANALICVHEGVIEIKCDKGDARALSGDCVFVPVGAFGSTYFLGEKNRAFIFLFDFDGDDVLNDVTLWRKIRGVESLVSDSLSAYYNGIVNINYYYSIFYRLIFEIQDNQKIAKKYEKVHQVMLEINKDYSRNAKISDYAKAALMCESGLRALFKEYTGKSIIEYRNDVRLKHAELLISEGISTREAALSVGFSSSAYYCRMVSKKRKKKPL